MQLYKETKEIYSEIEKLSNDSKLRLLLELLNELEKSDLPNDNSRDGSILLSNRTAKIGSELYTLIENILTVSDNLLFEKEYKYLAIKVLEKNGYHYGPGAMTSEGYWETSILQTKKGYFLF
jgi:hypothetical protein